MGAGTRSAPSPRAPEQPLRRRGPRPVTAQSPHREQGALLLPCAPTLGHQDGLGEPAVTSVVSSGAVLCFPNITFKG